MSDFEKDLKRLEAISDRLRNGEIPIAEATTLFEEGMALSQRLEKELQGMERRLEVLINDPEEIDDKPQFAPFPATEGDDPSSDE